MYYNRLNLCLIFRRHHGRRWDGATYARALSRATVDRANAERWPSRRVLAEAIREHETAVDLWYENVAKA